jgi:hypothetical protein
MGGGAVAPPSRLYYVGFCGRYQGKSRHPSTAFKSTLLTHSVTSAPSIAALRKAHSALVFATGADRADHFRVLVPALVSAVVSATDTSVVSKRKVNVSSR